MSHGEKCQSFFFFFFWWSYTEVSEIGLLKLDWFIGSLGWTWLSSHSGDQPASQKGLGPATQSWQLNCFTHEVVPLSLYLSHLLLERYGIIVPRGTCKPILWACFSSRAESFVAPKSSKRTVMYSLFVRDNIGTRFHKVEHHLESLISSRGLFFSHGSTTAVAVLIVLMLTRCIFHVHDKCCVLWKKQPRSCVNYEREKKKRHKKTPPPKLNLKQGCVFFFFFCWSDFLCK